MERNLFIMNNIYIICVYKKEYDFIDECIIEIGRKNMGLKIVTCVLSV